MFQVAYLGTIFHFLPVFFPLNVMKMSLQHKYTWVSRDPNPTLPKILRGTQILKQNGH